MVKFAGIDKNGEIISYESWLNYLDSIQSQDIIKDEDKASKLISECLESAVRSRIPDKRFGIFFSGGVDSTIIAYLCKKYSSDFICYTVGIDGSRDLESSEEVAAKLGLAYRRKKLLLREMEDLFESTAKILGRDLINIVNLGVGSVVLAASRIAKEDNIDIMFSGLGSEEIFAGYQRHALANDINKECWAGLKSMWERDFQRDFRISGKENLTLLTPFLDLSMIHNAMCIDGKLKIKKGIKKYILRVAAKRLGLPEEFAFRPKLAAQYGSSFDKAIQRITKAKGFKMKKQYLDYLSSRS